MIQALLNILYSDIEVWSLKRLKDTHDSTICPNTILPQPAIGTQTEIEIWEALVAKRLQVIQSQSVDPHLRPVAFSPRGQDGVIVCGCSGGCTEAYVISSRNQWDWVPHCLFGLDLRPQSRRNRHVGIRPDLGSSQRRSSPQGFECLLRSSMDANRPMYLVGPPDLFEQRLCNRDPRRSR